MKITLATYWIQWSHESNPKLQVDVVSDGLHPRMYIKSQKDYAIVFDNDLTIDIDVTTPSRDAITNELVVGLRKEQGNHQHQIDNIEEQIKNLLAIGYHPQEPIDDDIPF
jgi:hypothetical protein